jgi:O-antigen ligase
LPDSRELPNSSLDSCLARQSSPAKRVSFALFLISPLCILATAVIAIRFGTEISLIFASCVIFMFFSYYHFETAMLLMIFLLPFDLQRNLGGEYSLFADLAKLLLIPPILFLHPYRKLLEESKLCKIFLGTFLFIAIISLGRAIDLPFTAKLLVRQFSALFFGLMISVVFRSKEKLTRVTSIILLMAVLQGTYAAFQWFVGGFGSFWYWLNPEIAGLIAWDGRATGALGHPNALGGILTIGLCIAVTILASRHWNRWRLRLAVGIAIMMIGLLVSFSRGAWFAFALTGLILFLVEFRRNPWNRKLVLIPLLVGLLLLPIANSEIGSQVYQRATNIEPLSEYGRLALDYAALNMFLQHPLFGIGYGNWRAVLPDFFPGLSSSNIVEYFAFAHNIYLQVLCENGLTGFLLLFVPLGYLIAKGLRFAPRGDDGVSVLIRAYSFAMVGAFVCGLVDPWMDGSPSFASLFWAIVGLLMSGFAITQGMDGTSKAERYCDPSQMNLTDPSLLT